MKNNEIYLKEIMWLIIAGVFSFCFNYIFLHNLFVHPTSLNYISQDMNQHFIGWEFYRHDKWSWPISYISSIMYPVGSSTVFTDSSPIMMIFLKQLSPFLPDPFVYFGLENFINLALMFYAGNLLFRVMRKDDSLGLVGGLFFLFSGPVIFRFIPGHDTLAAQWLLIFNILLIIKPKHNIKLDSILQIFLLFISCGNHPYIAFMNLSLAFALAYKLSVTEKLNFSAVKFIQIVKLSLIYCLSFLIFGWFFGWFFHKSSGIAFGFGLYSANALSLINPEFGSILFRNLKIGWGQYEGYAYLGIDIIIPLLGILFFKAKLFKKYILKPELYGLYFILIVLYLFSLSNIVQIAGFSFRLGYSGDYLGVFRSSGRFIWPLYYFIIISTIIMIYDSFDNFQNAIKLLVLLLIIRVFDIFPLLHLVSNIFAAPQNQPVSLWAYDLKSLFWTNLEKNGIQHIILVEKKAGDLSPYLNSWNDKNNFPIIYKFSMLASLSNVTINDMNMSRRSNIEDVNIPVQYKSFMLGKLDRDTLYIVKDDILNLRTKDLNIKQCFMIDSYNLCTASKMDKAK